jgi:hypothetical protein
MSMCFSYSSTAIWEKDKGIKLHALWALILAWGIFEVGAPVDEIYSCVEVEWFPGYVHLPYLGLGLGNGDDRDTNNFGYLLFKMFTWTNGRERYVIYTQIVWHSILKK